MNADTVYHYVRRTATYNGKRYEARGKTAKEAERKLAEKLQAAKAGELSGDMTVDSWFQEWMETYKEPIGLQASVLATYHRNYRLHVKPTIGSRKLRDVKDAHLQRILNTVAKDNGKALVDKVRVLIHGMFRQARISRLIPYDPSEGLITPRAEEGHRRSLTEMERTKLLRTAETHPRGLWILTMLYTGMRPGETAALTWSAVDFQNNEIHITQAREAGTRTVKGPKTAAGVRDIPMRPELRAKLMAAKGEPFALVFPAASDGPAAGSVMARWWDSFSKAAGLPDDLTAYCLRHTFCTDLQAAGVPINVAKDLMGHTDISTTANIYTHRVQSTLHDAIATVAKGVANQNATASKA